MPHEDHLDCLGLLLWAAVDARQVNLAKLGWDNSLLEPTVVEEGVALSKEKVLTGERRPEL